MGIPVDLLVKLLVMVVVYLHYITNTCESISNIELSACACPLVWSDMFTHCSITASPIILTTATMSTSSTLLSFKIKTRQVPRLPHASYGLAFFLKS